MEIVMGVCQNVIVLTKNKQKNTSLMKAVQQSSKGLMDTA